MPEMLNRTLFLLFSASLPLTAFSVLNLGQKDLPISYVLFAVFVTCAWKSLLPKTQYKWDANEGALFAFIMWSLSSVLLASYGLDNLKMLTQIAVLIMMAMQFISIKAYLQSVEHLKLFQTLANLHIRVSFFFSLYTFYQLGAFIFGWPYRDYLRNSSAYSIFSSDTAGGWIDLIRITGPAPEPSYWASYVLLSICLLMPRVVRHFRLVDILMFTCLMASFSLTFSRTGYLSLICVTTCFVILKSSWHATIKKRLILAVLIGTVAILPCYFAYQKIKGDIDLSSADRLSGILTGLKMFLHNPFIGAGYGNFSEKSYEFYSSAAPQFDEPLLTTHNLYVQLLAETGLVGLLLFILFMSKTLFPLFKRIINENFETDDLTMGFFLAMISVLTSWLNFTAINFTYIWYFLAISVVLSEKNAKSN